MEGEISRGQFESGSLCNRPRADQIEMKVTAASVFEVLGRNGKLPCLVFALRFIYFCFI